MQSLTSSFAGLRLSPKTVSARVARSNLVVKAAVKADAAQVAVKKLDGSSVGNWPLALSVAPDATAEGLVHRYMVMFRQNNRAGTASTKTRSEVRGGGKKPYTQKKTGNARRGSSRSPLMVGGGILFGPKPRDWSISMNTKERRLAMATALQSAASNMIVVDSFDAMAEAKTKTLVSALQAMGADPMPSKENSGNPRILLVTRDVNEKIARSGRNVENLTICTLDSLNIDVVLSSKKIVIEKAAAEYIAEFYA